MNLLDKVVVTGSYEGLSFQSSIGIVVAVNEETGRGAEVCVCFEDLEDGHSGPYKIDVGYPCLDRERIKSISNGYDCWWIPKEMIEGVIDEKLTLNNPYWKVCNKISRMEAKRALLGYKSYI